MVSFARGRRGKLILYILYILTASWCGIARADRLAAEPLDPRETVLHPEDTVVVRAGGAVGANIYVHGRAYLRIAIAIQGDSILTLLVVTEAQKDELQRGGPLSGSPIVRLPINGDAGPSVTVQGGSYYVSILNDNPAPVSITYRVSALGF